MLIVSVHRIESLIDCVAALSFGDEPRLFWCFIVQQLELCPSRLLSSLLSFNQSPVIVSNISLPMSGTADGTMGQTSRCCMVCLMPQSQVSVSLEYSHLSMFTLDRPTCVRNWFSAFQVVQGLSAPGGSFRQH